MASSSTSQEMVNDVAILLPGDGNSSHGLNQSSQANLTQRGDSPPASKGPGLLERVQARVRPDEQYREEIVRSIFGEVGSPVEDFSCAIVSRILLHGRMYVTSSFVCFYSNLFGFEKIVKIPFCHMRCITKEKTALFIPNAIAIITSRKEYIFRSFWDREDAFRTLKNCHQASLRQSSLGSTQDPPSQEAEPSLVSLSMLPAAPPQKRERASEDAARLRSRSAGRAGDGQGDDRGSLDYSQSKRRLPWPGRTERRRSMSANGTLPVGDVGEKDARTASQHGGTSGAEDVSDKAAGVSQADHGGEVHNLRVSSIVSRDDNYFGASDGMTERVEGEAGEPGGAGDGKDCRDLPAAVGDENGGGADGGAGPGAESQGCHGSQGEGDSDGECLDGGGDSEVDVLGICLLDGSDPYCCSFYHWASKLRAACEPDEDGPPLSSEEDPRTGADLKKVEDTVNRNLLKDGGCREEYEVEGSPVDTVSLGGSNGDGRTHTKVEEFKLAVEALGDGWFAGSPSEKAKQERARAGATSRISAELPCDIQMFFDKFIANDAEKGFPSFHESIGDTDVQATPWKVSGGAMGMTREIRFVHPVSAPIGPSSTRAVKLQRCRTYDACGLIMETSTHLEDIVMNDYFRIEDRCVVQPGREGTVRLDVEVEIKFVKSTMLRKAIETKSLNETREVWDMFVAMVKEALSSHGNRVAARQLHYCGNDSDDEDLIRRTRERLRERRKYRHRHRHHHPPPPPPHYLPSHLTAPAHVSTHHEQPQDAPQDGQAASNGTAKGAETPRPRARSSVSRIPSVTLPEQGNAAEGRTPRGSAGGRAEKKSKAASGVTAAVSSTSPSGALSYLVASPVSLGWILLGLVLIWEVLQFLRFQSEVSGFLEAAEGALSALQGEVVPAEQEGEDEDGGAAAVVGATSASATALVTVAVKKEIAQRLVEVYTRNRFVWPLSVLLRW